MGWDRGQPASGRVSRRSPLPPRSHWFSAGICAGRLWGEVTLSSVAPKDYRINMTTQYASDTGNSGMKGSMVSAHTQLTGRQLREQLH